MATNNTLIVYASRHGNVERCARELFDLLDGKVDICNLNDRELFPDASTYDSVIIGGSIYEGKIQESVSGFCDVNLEILTKKRIGLFISCLYSDKKAQAELQDAFPAELLNMAVVSDFFGGEINTARLSFLEKIITHRMSESGELVSLISQQKIREFAKKMNLPNAL
ncbi:MAG: flavodoxin domain-containing protein [Bacteroidia bacterium]|nr:flavodoxin domain-containing protein [Bacteroidia bacterium]